MMKALSTLWRISHADPKDLYIESPTPITLKELAELYADQPSCTHWNLKKRSTQEGWIEARKSFQQAASAQQETRMPHFQNIDKPEEPVSQDKAWETDTSNANSDTISIEDFSIKKPHILLQEAYARTEKMLKINEQKLQEGIIKNSDEGESINIAAKDLRILQQNLHDLYQDLKRYSEEFYAEQQGHSSMETADSTKAVLLKTLFGDLLESFSPPEV